jgi:hypothetical protein
MAAKKKATASRGKKKAAGTRRKGAARKGAVRKGGARKKAATRRGGARKKAGAARGARRKATPTSRGGARKKAARRERMSPRGDTRFVRRTRTGRFDEVDDAGRSLARDTRTRAKRKVRSGQGDRGDQ